MSRLAAILLALALLLTVALALAWTERAAIGRLAAGAVALRFVWWRLCRAGVRDA